MTTMTTHEPESPEQSVSEVTARIAAKVLPMAEHVEKFYRTPNGEAVEITPEKLPDGSCAVPLVRTDRRDGHHGLAVSRAKARVIRPQRQCE